MFQAVVSSQQAVVRETHPVVLFDYCLLTTIKIVLQDNGRGDVVQTLVRPRPAPACRRHVLFSRDAGEPLIVEDNGEPEGLQSLRKGQRALRLGAERAIHIAGESDDNGLDPFGVADAADRPQVGRARRPPQGA